MNCRVDQKIILLVDDEPHVTNIVRMKMAGEPFDVHVARNGQDGFELATALQPDVIVSDYQMPRVSGIEMCQQLVMNPITAKIPIILLTSCGFLIPQSVIEQTNIQCVLEKPFSPAHLIDRCLELIGHRQEASL